LIAHLAAQREARNMKGNSMKNGEQQGGSGGGEQGPTSTKEATREFQASAKKKWEGTLN